MKIAYCLAAIALVSSPSTVSSQSYLFVWAGGRGGSEFVATIDANPASATYGRVLASAPTGVIGSPHHTEPVLGPGGHLLANDFHAGRTWLFDLHEPLHPHVLTSFGDVSGYSHPHTFIRLANGRVLSTFQYRAEPGTDAQSEATAASAISDMAHMAPMHATGGLVMMDERGHAFSVGSAADTTIADRRLYPYSVLPIPALDRAISTTTDMDHADTVATSQWIQLWRLSDLKLLRSIALPPGPRGDENTLTGEPRLLADGRSIYIHTFSCGLFLLRGVDGNRPVATFVKGFEGTMCGVPILTGHYWIQTVPAMHGVVVLDIADPEHPREVSRLDVGSDESPHWIAIDATGRRIVLNSAGKGNRLFVINFDPASGHVVVDERFRDPGSDHAGISLAGSNWPRDYTGSVVPHGAVFSTP
ncbi:MAG: hypothetical protein M3Y30_07205 [Gemmatimonadota bacterium]|nr:hypothetical protein [Gemmatimonadota bacterium]